MANFPTSAPSFTNKSAGQTIQSAHMNAVQDELIAIGGIVNGPAPISCSNVTVNELTVTRGLPSVRAYNSADLPVGNATFTALTLNSERYASTSGMHSTGSNPS